MFIMFIMFITFIMFIMFITSVIFITFIMFIMFITFIVVIMLVAVSFRASVLPSQDNVQISLPPSLSALAPLQGFLQAQGTAGQETEDTEFLAKEFCCLKRLLH